MPALRQIVACLNDKGALSFGQITVYELRKTERTQLDRKSATVARAILMESDVVVLKRRQYIRQLGFLKESMPMSQVIYLDETSVDTRICGDKVWRAPETRSYKIVMMQKFFIFFLQLPPSFILHALSSCSDDVFKSLSYAETSI